MVAVKVLSPKVAQHLELKQRFTHEARALAKLSHPNVVSVFDARVEDGEAYLVMEYLEGGSLAERLPLSAAEAVQAALSVCEAVQAVHDAGLLHRDIKPANIILGKNGEVKLSDFGIARSAETQGLMQQGLALGTSGFVDDFGLCSQRMGLPVVFDAAAVVLHRKPAVGRQRCIDTGRWTNLFTISL